jgi:hypothetical protein
MRYVILVLCLFCLSAAPARPSGPRLIITEIQYDPASEESDDLQTEWVEICNNGNAPANLQGYQLTSGTKARPHDPKQRFVLGNVTLKPGEHAVIGIGTPAAYENLNLPPFIAHAGETRYAWLTNGGDSVAIRDAKGVIIDEVVYEIDAPWPIVKASGSSIQFKGKPGEDAAAANDDPANWAASDSTNSDAYPEHGRGTPGGPPKSGAATKPAKK